MNIPVCLISLFLGAYLRQVSPMPARPHQDQFLIAIDKRIERLSDKAGFYPPSVSTSTERSKLIRDIKEIAIDLEGKAAKKSDAWEIQWRLGECYQMGHNLDIPHAWKRSESHLKKAISLRPKETKPYLMLGLLYVNSDMNLAPDAEKLFKKAIEISAPKPLPEAYEGLTFSLYYQSQRVEALKAAEEGLRLDPANKKLLSMHEVLKKLLDKSGPKSP